MFQGLKDWYNQPYKSDMSATKWFLLIGLVLLCLAIWKVLVSHLMDVA